MTETIREEVRAALKRNPEADSRWVQAAVAARIPEAAEVPLRSFHARYVLPEKRKAGRGRRRAEQTTARPRPSQAATRRAVREELVGIVRAAVVSDPRQIIDLVAGLERRAQRIVDLVTGGVGDGAE